MLCCKRLVPAPGITSSRFNDSSRFFPQQGLIYVFKYIVIKVIRIYFLLAS